jgi:hypothetical protein
MFEEVRTSERRTGLPDPEDLRDLVAQVGDHLDGVRSASRIPVGASAFFP